MKIAITGASGLIASKLIPLLRADNHEVIKFTRRKESSRQEEVFWDYKNSLLEIEKLEGVDAVINLAGFGIADSRWSDSVKMEIRESRVTATRFLFEKLNTLKSRPKSFISASAIGYYGERGDEILNESSVSGRGFLAEVGKDWEEAANIPGSPIRVVYLRTAMVLSCEGGALKRMLLPFKLGMGAGLGTGRQYVSWIHIDDHVNAIKFLLNNSQLNGPFNLSATNPVTNNEFTKALAKALNRPALFNAPEFALRLMFGEMAEQLLLSSQRVVPQRLIDAGFEFKFPTIEAAFKDLVGK